MDFGISDLYTRIGRSSTIPEHQEISTRREFHPGSASDPSNAPPDVSTKGLTQVLHGLVCLPNGSQSQGAAELLPCLFHLSQQSPKHADLLSDLLFKLVRFDPPTVTDILFQMPELLEQAIESVDE
jgi:hypothetical protein